ALRWRRRRAGHHRLKLAVPIRRGQFPARLCRRRRKLPLRLIALHLARLGSGTAGKQSHRKSPEVVWPCYYMIGSGKMKASGPVQPLPAPASFTLHPSPFSSSRHLPRVVQEIADPWRLAHAGLLGLRIFLRLGLVVFIAL